MTAWGVVAVAGLVFGSAALVELTARLAGRLYHHILERRGGLR